MGSSDVRTNRAEPFDTATVGRCWNEAQRLIADVAGIAQAAAVATEEQVAAELAAQQQTPPR